MAIKRRERPAVDSAAIDSFGDAADVPAEQPAPTVSTPPAPAAAVGESPAPAPARAAARPRAAKPSTPAVDAPQAWPADLSKTFLLRFADPSIPLQIEELQQLVGRNKHQTYLLALRRGLDALRAEAEALGGSAELIK